MNKTKVLLIALASMVATACISDDVNHIQSNADVAKMKIVNNAESAEKGELILYVDDATASLLEDAKGATRSGATAFDAAIAEIGATEVKPVFNMLDGRAHV